MHVEQISVFLENKAGRLSEVTSILAENEINIRALSLADTSDFGVLRLIVDKNDKARTVLKNNGFAVGKTEVVAVEVADQPGGLHTTLGLFQQAGINVEYMYAVVRQSGENAVMIFRLDDIEKGVQMLKESGARVIDGEQIYKI
jgi:hypothetical protein